MAGGYSTGRRSCWRSPGERKIETTDLTLFYYEAFDHQFDAKMGAWLPFAPESSFTTNVEVPMAKTLRGVDVVTFIAQTSPECSPLSCNGLAREMPVNRFCLFDDFASAYEAVAAGKFNDSEPGPYRIFAVYTVESSIPVEGR